MISQADSPIDPAIDDSGSAATDLRPADEDARKSSSRQWTSSMPVRRGSLRCGPHVNEVVVDERAKRAILLSFKVLEMGESAAGDFLYHDRMPLKTRFDGVRVVPGAIARWGSYMAPGVVLMPSYVNIGGYVGAGTMVDTWATVGSCAQVGERVHLSGGVGLGGVLEPPNAIPVVIEDDAFIGSRSMVVDGARVRRGAKLGAGAFSLPAQGFSTRRAVTSCPVVRYRSGLSWSGRARCVRSPAASSRCRACSCCAHWPKARSTTSSRSTTSFESTAFRRDRARSAVLIRST